MTKETVLVTGGTGFIAQYCIISLIKQGYRVRTTVRSAQRENEVRQKLQQGGVDPGEKLTFVVADLMADQCWDAATQGCTYVLQGATPTTAREQVTEGGWMQHTVEGK